MSNITYHKEGDYYIPNLYLENENYKNDYHVGKYGNLRLRYLKEHKKAEYIIMFMDNRLRKHIVDTDIEANNKLNTLIKQFVAKENITEELKANNQLEWVQAMNNIKNRAEEIIYSELIYK